MQFEKVLIENLRQLATNIENLAAILQDVNSNPAKEDDISIEKVRAVLAEKSRSGKQPEVKVLITKYGAKKLTDIDPKNYNNLLKEAEEL